MQLELENAHTPNAIKHYQAGTIQVKDERYNHDLIITATSITAWKHSELKQLDLAELTAHQPDVILLGTGERMQFLETKLLLELQQQGIGVEVMTTAAACRTFNVLLSEDRNVLAALKV